MNLKKLAFLPDDIDYRLGAKVNPNKATAAPVITPAPPFMIEGYACGGFPSPVHMVAGEYWIGSSARALENRVIGQFIAPLQKHTVNIVSNSGDPDPFRFVKEDIRAMREHPFDPFKCLRWKKVEQVADNVTVINAAENLKQFITPPEKPAVSDSVTHMEVRTAAYDVMRVHGADFTRGIVFRYGDVSRVADIPEDKLKTVYDELQRHIPKITP